MSSEVVRFHSSAQAGLAGNEPIAQPVRRRQNGCGSRAARAVVVSERASVRARAEATRRTARSPRRETLNSAAVTGSYGRVRAEAVSIPCGQRGESSCGGARLRSPPRPAAAHPQAQNGLLCGQVSVEMQERQGSAGGVKWIRKI